MSKKNSRHCPALQSDITSKECGNDRHSRIPCTADCPFNPFALENYDDLLPPGCPRIGTHQHIRIL